MIDSRQGFDSGICSESPGDFPAFAVVLSDFMPKAVLLGRPDDFLIAVDCGASVDLIEFDAGRARFSRVDGLSFATLVFECPRAAGEPSGSGRLMEPVRVEIDSVPFERADEIEALMSGAEVELSSKYMAVKSREGLLAFRIGRTAVGQGVQGSWSRRHPGAAEDGRAPDGDHGRFPSGPRDTGAKRFPGSAKPSASPGPPGVRCSKCLSESEEWEPFCLICGSDLDRPSSREKKGKQASKAASGRSGRVSAPGAAGEAGGGAAKGAAKGAASNDSDKAGTGPSGCFGCFGCFGKLGLAFLGLFLVASWLQSGDGQPDSSISVRKGNDSRRGRKVRSQTRAAVRRPAPSPPKTAERIEKESKTESNESENTRVEKTHKAPGPIKSPDLSRLDLARIAMGEENFSVAGELFRSHFAVQANMRAPAAPEGMLDYAQCLERQGRYDEGCLVMKEAYRLFYEDEGYRARVVAKLAELIEKTKKNHATDGRER